MSALRGRWLPIFAVLAAGLAMLAWPATTHPASANVTSTDASVASFESGSDGTTITIGAQDDDGDLTMTLTEIDPSTEVTLSAVLCTPACPGGAVTYVDATKTVRVVTTTFDDDGTPEPIEVSFAVNATCDNDDTMRLTAKQGNGEGDVDTTIFVQCDAPDPNVIILNDAPDAGANDNFEYSLTANRDDDCEDDEVLLVDGEERGFVCQGEGGTYTARLLDLPAGFTLDEISCERSGVPSGDVVVSLSNRRVAITLKDDGDAVKCTFTSVSTATPTPAATSTPVATSTPAPTSTPAAPALLDLSASSTLLPCNGSSTVNALVRDVAGQTVANGTLVSFVASSGGGLSSGTIGTVNGIATVVFNATTTSTATITASTGGVSKSLVLQVNCGVPGQPGPPTLPGQAPNGPIIRPPNTGDAGMIENVQTSACAGATLIFVGTLMAVAASIRARL